MFPFSGTYHRFSGFPTSGHPMFIGPVDHPPRASHVFGDFLFQKKNIPFCSVLLCVFVCSVLLFLLQKQHIPRCAEGLLPAPGAPAGQHRQHVAQVAEAPASGRQHPAPLQAPGTVPLLRNSRKATVDGRNPRYQENHHFKVQNHRAVGILVGGCGEKYCGW